MAALKKENPTRVFNVSADVFGGEGTSMFSSASLPSTQTSEFDGAFSEMFSSASGPTSSSDMARGEAVMLFSSAS